VQILTFDPDGRVAVISIEDIIADPVGQFASGSAADMLEQARTLFSLHPDADLAYLERRMREETSSEHGIASLEG
jgi:hypothetical protein